MERSRRNWLKRLTAGLMTVVTLPGINQKDIPMTEADRKRQKDRERMKQAEREDERQVEALYSTKPIRVRLVRREYMIPANHFTPKGRDNNDTFNAEDYFGFYLFLPDYGGYTKENWRDPFDPRRITIVQVSPVEKNAIGVFTDGTRRPLSPDRFDPRKNFESLRFLMEEKPSFNLHGLEVYRRKGKTEGAFWAGKRSNGEFFFFKTPLAPDEPLKPGIANPLCDVRYYSDKEDLSIVYRYSQQHIAKWREIDDAIWTKLHGWQVK